ARECTTAPGYHQIRPAWCAIRGSKPNTGGADLRHKELMSCCSRKKNRIADHPCIAVQGLRAFRLTGKCRQKVSSHTWPQHGTGRMSGALIGRSARSRTLTI